MHIALAQNGLRKTKASFQSCGVLMCVCECVSGGGGKVKERVCGFFFPF